MALSPRVVLTKAVKCLQLSSTSLTVINNNSDKVKVKVNACIKYKQFLITNLSRCSTLQPIRDSAAAMMLSQIPNSTYNTTCTNQTDTKQNNVAFVDAIVTVSHLGDQIPQTTHFRGCEQTSSSQSSKIPNLHIVKTTRTISSKFCTTTKTTKCAQQVVQLCILPIHDGRQTTL